MPSLSSSSSVLRLYREMLRSAAKLENYNFSHYALRRIKEEFHTNKKIKADSTEQKQALEAARQQADMLHRQMVVSKLYPPLVKSVMETPQ
uniref:Complex 1 LYR protein domain-containing protein n=1 Tax=Peronospora matthiolae TaxID=2874970 RepID=A0AAV1TSV9_9STRA